MARPYKKLRDLLRQRDISNEILAEELGEHLTTISRKMNCHSAWTCNQMWKIMELLNLPDSMLAEVFPKNGRNKPEQTGRTYRKAV